MTLHFKVDPTALSSIRKRLDSAFGFPKSATNAKGKTVITTSVFPPDEQILRGTDGDYLFSVDSGLVSDEAVQGEMLAILSTGKALAISKEIYDSLLPTFQTP